MNRQKMYATLIVLPVVFAGCQLQKAPTTPMAQMEIPSLSCVGPTPGQAAECQKIEQEIIASTVQIELEGVVHIGSYPRQISDMSHATIMGGCYLVTHNHYNHPLTDTAGPDGDGYTGITLKRISGEKLLDAAPLTSFSIVYEDPQTLVLDFRDVNGKGLFETLGLRSAPTLDWDTVPWEMGMELAQLDWDGETTHVDWVKVDAFWTNIQVPIVVVDNFVMQGASGGGLFWNGYHVGNNWLRNVDKNEETSQVARAYTIVALNSSDLVRFDPNTLTQK